MIKAKGTSRTALFIVALFVLVGPRQSRALTRRIGQKGYVGGIAVERVVSRPVAYGPFEPGSGRAVSGGIAGSGSGGGGENVYLIEDPSTRGALVKDRCMGGQYAENQWWLDALGARDAWKRTRGDSTVVIALIDTGCDMEHPALRGAIWVNRPELEGMEGVDDDGNGYVDDRFGWDFVTASGAILYDGEDGAPGDPDPTDFCGHGTHLAGIMVSSDSVSPGLAPGCRVMVLRAGFKSSDGNVMFLERDVAGAVRYAVSMGADVINLSIGGMESENLRLLLSDAVAKGVVVVSAAGNFGTEKPVYPAAYGSVLSVGAAGRDGGLAVFSSRGSWVDCSAPGVSILSTVPGGYGEKSGTSQAAAFVSAVAALVRSLHPDWTPQEVEAQILNTAVAIDNDPPRNTPACRADRAVEEEPEVRVEYLGCRPVVRRVDRGALVELGCRVLNRWKAVSSASVEISLQCGGYEVLSGKVVEIGSMGASEIREAAFQVGTGNFDEQGETSFNFDLVVRADGETFRFTDLVDLREVVGIKRIAWRLSEVQGDGDGGLDPSERGRIDVLLENDSGGEVSLLFTPVGPPFPFVEVNVEHGELTMAPGDTSSFSMEFEVADDPEAAGLHELCLSVESELGSLSLGFPVWVSFRGVDRLDECISFQGDGGHTGVFEGDYGGPWKEAWRRVIYGKGGIVSQPLVAGGICYVLKSSRDSCFVYALNEEEGDMLWRKRLAGGGIGERPLPLSFSRGVLVAAWGGALHALYYASGEIVWHVSAEDIGLGTEARFGAPSICGEMVYATVQSMDRSGAGYLVALDLFTGKVVWIVEVGRNLYVPPYPPTCDGGLVSFVTADGDVRTYDAAEGSLLWVRRTTKSPVCAPAARGGRLIVLGADGTVSCLKRENGGMVFERKAGSIPIGAPCFVDPGGEMERGWFIFPARDGDKTVLEALGVDDGKVCAGPDVPFELSGGVSANGFVVLTAYEGGLAALGYEVTGEPWNEFYGEFELYVADDLQGCFGSGSKPVPGTPLIVGGRVFVSYHGPAFDMIVCFEPYHRNDGVAEFLSNSPNPFNPSTEIRFTIASPTDVDLRIYDVSGRLVRRFGMRGCSPGTHVVLWDGKNSRGLPVVPGVYLCMMKAGGTTLTRKMILLR